MQSQHETIDNPDNMYNESIGAKIEHNRNSNNLSDMKLKEIEDQFMLKLKEINFLTSVSFIKWLEYDKYKCMPIIDNFTNNISSFIAKIKPEWLILTYLR